MIVVRQTAATHPDEDGPCEDTPHPSPAATDDLVSHCLIFLSPGLLMPPA